MAEAIRLTTGQCLGAGGHCFRDVSWTKVPYGQPHKEYRICTHCDYAEIGDHQPSVKWSPRDWPNVGGDPFEDKEVNHG